MYHKSAQVMYLGKRVNAIMTAVSDQFKFATANNGNLLFPSAVG